MIFWLFHDAQYDMKRKLKHSSVSPGKKKQKTTKKMPVEFMSARPLCVFRVCRAAFVSFLIVAFSVAAVLKARGLVFVFWSAVLRQQLD